MKKADKIYLWLIFITGLMFLLLGCKKEDVKPQTPPAERPKLFNWALDVQSPSKKETVKYVDTYGFTTYEFRDVPVIDSSSISINGSVIYKSTFGYQRQMKSGDTITIYFESKKDTLKRFSFWRDWNQMPDTIVFLPDNKNIIMGSFVL